MLTPDSTPSTDRLENPASAAGKIIIVIGSRNRKKCREMAELIAPAWQSHHRLSRLEIRSLDDYPSAPEVIEDADTFAGNARKKAAEVARALAVWVLADDSGLSVDALNGAPGIYSARYAGEPSDDAANNRKLLDDLAPIPDDRRTAKFHCALALADPSGRIRLESQGECRGLILRQLSGPGGFGYDPLFFIREYHKTFGELSPLVKHQLSHRARAFSHLRAGLESMIAQGHFDTTSLDALPGETVHATKV